MGKKCPAGHEFCAETTWRRSLKVKCSSKSLVAHIPSLGVSPSPLKFHSYCISETHLSKNVANSTPRKGSRHPQQQVGFRIYLSVCFSKVGSGAKMLCEESRMQSKCLTCWSKGCLIWICSGRRPTLSYGSGLFKCRLVCR